MELVSVDVDGKATGTVTGLVQRPPSPLLHHRSIFGSGEGHVEEVVPVLRSHPAAHSRASGPIPVTTTDCILMHLSLAMDPNRTHLSQLPSLTRNHLTSSDFEQPSLSWEPGTVGIDCVDVSDSERQMRRVFVGRAS